MNVIEFVYLRWYKHYDPRLNTLSGIVAMLWSHAPYYWSFLMIQDNGCMMVSYGHLSDFEMLYAKKSYFCCIMFFLWLLFVVQYDYMKWYLINLMMSGTINVYLESSLWQLMQMLRRTHLLPFMHPITIALDGYFSWHFVYMLSAVSKTWSLAPMV